MVVASISTKIKNHFQAPIPNREKHIVLAQSAIACFASTGAFAITTTIIKMLTATTLTGISLASPIVMLVIGVAFVIFAAYLRTRFACATDAAAPQAPLAPPMPLQPARQQGVPAPQAPSAPPMPLQGRLGHGFVSG